MLILSLPVVSTAIAVCTLLYVWKCFSSPLWSAPGPFVSRLTSAVLRWHEFHSNRTLYVHSLHQKYGAGVRIAPNEMSFASYDGFKEIYGSMGSGYDKSHFYNLFTVLGRRTMFSTLDKAPHARRKRLVADRYANTNVVKPKSLGGIESLARDFAQQCGEADGRSVDIYVKLHSFACDGVTHHLFHPYGSNCLRNESDQDMMHQVTTDGSLRSRLIKLHAPAFYSVFSGIIHMFAPPRATPLADHFVDQRSQSSHPEEFTLLHRLREKLNDQLDQTDITAECYDHMVAGIDTTGDSLCFLMWELSQPRSLHIQHELREELRKNRDVDFDKLPFLNAVVQEGLRCFPAIPMSLPRVVPEGGRIVDGIAVPQGTIVSSQAHSVHRHNTDVFPNPELFNPDRWMASEGDMDRKRHMFAFSHGGRGCVGKHLALAEMKLLLREVYSRFETKPDSSTTDESMRSHDQIISASPHGQKCLLRFVSIAEH